MQKEGGGLVPRIQWLCALVKSLPAPSAALQAAQTSCRARLRLAVSNPLVIPYEPPLLLRQMQPEDEVSTTLHS